MEGTGAAPAVGAATRGGAITVASQLVRILLQIASIPVLARLLSPDDFGLVATVMVLVALGGVIKDFGLGAATLQASKVSVAERSTLFWANVAIGSALAALMVPAALAMPLLFDRSELFAITLSLGLTFPIGAAQTQYLVGLARKGRYVSLNAAMVGSQALGLGAAIAAAAANAGYWSLVAQQITTSTVGLALLLVCGRWLPMAPWRIVDIRPFLAFGANLGASQLMVFLATNADTAVISYRFGAGATGLYNRAFQLLIGPLYQLAGPLMHVVVPALSQAKARSRDEFLSMLRAVTVSVGLPLGALLATGAGMSHELVALLLGPQWVGTGELLAIMSLGGMFQALLFISFWTFLALARTRQLVSFTLVLQTGTVLAILVGSHWGVSGVAWGVFASLAAGWPLSLLWLHRCYNLPRQALLWPGARGLVAGGAVIVVLRLAPVSATPASIGIWSVLGGLLFIGVMGLTTAGRRDLSTLWTARRHLLSS